MCGLWRLSSSPSLINSHTKSMHFMIDNCSKLELLQFLVSYATSSYLNKLFSFQLDKYQPANTLLPLYRAILEYCKFQRNSVFSTISTEWITRHHPHKKSHGFPLQPMLTSFFYYSLPSTRFFPRRTLELFDEVLGYKMHLSHVMIARVNGAGEIAESRE